MITSQDPFLSQRTFEVDRRLVVLESEIQIKARQTQQTEIFYLIQKGGWWLINELVAANVIADFNPLHRNTQGEDVQSATQLNYNESSYNYHLSLLCSLSIVFSVDLIFLMMIFPR